MSVAGPLGKIILLSPDPDVDVIMISTSTDVAPIRRRIRRRHRRWPVESVASVGPAEGGGGKRCSRIWLRESYI